MSKLDKKAKRRELVNKVLDNHDNQEYFYDIIYRDFWESWYIHNTTRQPRIYYDKYTKMRESQIQITISLINPELETSFTIPYRLEPENIIKQIEEYLKLVEELQEQRL
jgi:hypothetical protein